VIAPRGHPSRHTDGAEARFQEPVFGPARQSPPAARAFAMAAFEPLAKFHRNGYCTLWYTILYCTMQYRTSLPNARSK
jgi:hypothetical protein